jgi:hypothetical protein
VGQLIGTDSSRSIYKDLSAETLPSLLADLEAAVPQDESAAIKKVADRLSTLPGRESSDPVDETFLKWFGQTIDNELRLSRWRGN